MTIVATAELIRHARGAGTGIAAFNVITLEHAEGVVAAAEQTRRPAIVQISQNAVRFHGALAPIAAAAQAVAAASTAEIAFHLDHVEDVALLHQAAAAGFSSAMFDASALPYVDNVEATRSACAWAHANGLWLEGELGYVGGKPDAPTSAHADGVRTDPAEARDFVSATGVDALAVAVGSTHAMTERTAALDVDLVARLAAALDLPLVLHGASGVRDEQLGEAIRAGLTKINVGTALNVAFSAAVRAVLVEQPELTDPRRYLAPARTALTDAAAHLLQVIG